MDIDTKNWYQNQKLSLINPQNTCLFFWPLYDKTLGLKNEICHGSKIAKDLLIVLLCINKNREFETPLINGQLIKPHCSKV